MTTNKMFKKSRTFRKHGFQRQNSLKISDEKKNRNKILDHSKTLRGTQGSQMKGILAVIKQVI